MRNGVSVWQYDWGVTPLLIPEAPDVENLWRTSIDAACEAGLIKRGDRVVITAGTYDILIETVCEDNEGLLRFLAERLRTIDGVRDTETFVYLRMVKQSYQWGTR